MNRRSFIRGTGLSLAGLASALDSDAKKKANAKQRFIRDKRTFEP